jgi:hypothetical protein
MADLFKMVEILYYFSKCSTWPTFQPNILLLYRQEMKTLHREKNQNGGFTQNFGNDEMTLIQSEC